MTTNVLLDRVQDNEVAESNAMVHRHINTTLDHYERAIDHLQGREFHQAGIVFNHEARTMWGCPTVEELALATLLNDPRLVTYSEENWEIVPEGTMASGKHSIEACAEPHNVFNVEWPTSVRHTASFTLFGNLPVELRLKIWKHALPEPRVVQLKLQDDIRRYPFHPLLVGRPPAGIQHRTCGELWSVFTEQYHRVKISQDIINTQANGDSNVDSTITTYYHYTEWVDGKRDTLLVSAGAFRDRSYIDLSKIQNLAISEEYELHSGLPGPSIWTFIGPRCPVLKRFHIVLDNPNNDEGNKDRLLRLVDIDANARYWELACTPYPDNHSLRNASAFEREPELLDLVQDATEIRNRFQQCLDKSQDWESIDFRVSCLAVECDRDCWYTESISIAPKPRIPVEIAFRLQKPIFPCEDSNLFLVGRDDPYMVIACNRAGTIYSPYDGIKELFESDRKIGEEPRDLRNLRIRNFDLDRACRYEVEMTSEFGF
ncbi:hypothetical protein EG329_005954 [Mollisiaceae sp. DMI_Dod_QoI]|nr:hypothetical protein EG329_005954 [Helotiales sp. DMI_Dod_QoI]